MSFVQPPLDDDEDDEVDVPIPPPPDVSGGFTSSGALMSEQAPKKRTDPARDPAKEMRRIDA